MATIGDALIVIGILFFICFLIVMVNSDKIIQPSDYNVCINHCPKTMSDRFTNFDCPKMCAETVLKFTQADSTESVIIT